MPNPLTSAGTASATPDSYADLPQLDLLSLPVERAVDRVIAYAAERRASDLYLLSHESFLAVEIRQHGIIRRIALVGVDEGRRFIQHIKAAAGMDVAKARVPADGRWIHQNVPVKNYAKAAAASEQPKATTVDLRISTIPTLHGEDMALRMLARETGMYELNDLGMHNRQRRRVEQMLDRPSGLILCTGPTGSGKTATLYAALNHLNNGERKINTIEDPIEFDVDGFRQSQVHEKLNLHFADLLRSILRQSPDIIMVGEIRDGETAQTAVRAANSGHLVFSTLHAPVAAAAVQSMRALGVPPHFLATALRGVVSQRLARTLCPACRQAFPLDDAPGMFDEIADLLVDAQGSPQMPESFYAAGSCSECDQSGYAGRTGIFEVLTVNRALRDLIARNASASEIEDAARRADPAQTNAPSSSPKGTTTGNTDTTQTMLGFRRAALLKVARGITTFEEILRVIPREELLTED